MSPRLTSRSPHLADILKSMTRSLIATLFLSFVAHAGPDAGELDPSSPTWRSSEGFQTARWGMTTAEVKREFPKVTKEKGTSSPEIWSMGTTVAGFPAILGFMFTRDRLGMVGVQFKRGDFDQLIDALTKKYGQPTSDEDDGLEPQRVWHTGPTMVMLRKKLGGAVTLAYMSVDLRGLKDPLPQGAESEL